MQPPAPDPPRAGQAADEAASPAPEEPALQALRQAFQLAAQDALDINTLLTVAGALTAASNSALVIRLYRVWLAHTTSPFAPIIWFNLGTELAKTGDYAEVETAYRRSLQLNPNFHLAALALGQEFERQKRIDEAIGLWRETEPRIDTLTPDGRDLAVHLLNNLGRVLRGRRHLQEAERALEKSLILEPRQPIVAGTLVSLRQHVCAWPILRPIGDLTADDMARFTVSIPALSVFDDPLLQVNTARSFLETRFGIGRRLDGSRLSPPGGYDHGKARIGYLSSDFRGHALSGLIVEMLELHDRSRVEIYGFCWAREESSELRKRVIGALDHHVPIGGLDDDAAARCIRSFEIDVLVDLNGLASDARPGILSRRPAPVQVSYLGFPGSTGHPAIDFVVADEYVLPRELRPYFSETPLYLPTVFQVSDRRRSAGSPLTREGYGLPEGAVVFCSFSNTHKITEELFSIWMSILRRTPGSVLWLLADNPWAQENMIRHAERKGVEPSRLIFAGRVPPHDYLVRYLVADLFLDTFPFNAGATANDALWMGLPILTCSGRTFASRMAGSLLSAAGLPELITTDLAGYEDKAVALLTSHGVV